jgi:diguanylate cyclase (GGDEF)-like protein
MNALSGMQMVRWEDEVVVSDERRCFENTLVPVAGSGQVPTMIYSTRRDITAQKEADQLRELAATTDALTGLRNRRFAEERLAAEFERAKRYGQLLSVLIMDIDHFKQVNDTYGHDTGDRVIKQFGALLQRHARSTDVVARWGGEEFLLIAPHTDIAGAMQNAERICAAARCLAVPADQQEIRFTVSIGVAQFGQEAHSLDLVKTADQALYLAKRTGRDRALQSGTFAHQGPGPVLRL